MRATIKDVSEAAGVSVATVSNVLNAPERVAPTTSEKVPAVIERLGYRPSRAARALQQQRTRSFGYRIPIGTHEFALDVFLHHMVERAGRADLDIVLFTAAPGQSETDAYRSVVRRGGVDGFILSETEHGDDRVRYLLDTGVPFATFGRTDVGDEHPWVDIDGRAGVRGAVDHLVALGHRDIALIRWPEGSLSGDERAAGYVDGLEAAGLGVDSRLVTCTENSVECGRMAMDLLLSSSRRPTAVIAVQDVLAVGASVAIQQAGVSVGSDIAVVGFDNTPMARFATPSLTSVRQPLDEIGGLVVELLIDRLDGIPGADARSALVEPGLVVRASSTGDNPGDPGC